MNTQHFTFTATVGGETLTMTTDAVMPPEVIEAFERFLRGAGFTFAGRLEIVDGNDDGADDFGMAED